MSGKLEKLLLAVLVALLMGLGAGCGDDSADTASNNAYVGNNGSTGEWSGGDSADEGGAGAGPGGGSGEQGQETPQRKPGQLTAGEWSDLENWSFWTDLPGQNPDADVDGHQAHWNMHATNRFAVRVVLADAPVIDAKVTLMGDGQAIWEARTDNRGRAELYDGFFGEATAADYSLEVDTGSETKTVDVDGPTGGERLDIAVDAADEPAPSLDLMFVVDTTGSMGDELSYIQAELRDVIQQTRQNSGNELDIRLSVNFYKDTSDEYVVRPFPFTTDIDQALDDLKDQTVGGGGDFPEAVGAALSDAVDSHQWRQEATARLMFLVLDAPPHHNPQVLDSLQSATEAAAAQGIRIIPVVGSGIDKPTEFLMRLLSIASGGTYVFLTDHSGIGGSHIEPTIGDYEVEYLNDLLVRVISEYTEQD